MSHIQDGNFVVVLRIGEVAMFVGQNRQLILCLAVEPVRVENPGQYRGGGA